MFFSNKGLLYLKKNPKTFIKYNSDFFIVIFIFLIWISTFFQNYWSFSFWFGCFLEEEMITFLPFFFFNLSTPSTHHVAHNKTVLYEIIKALAIFLMFDMHLCLWWYMNIPPAECCFSFYKSWASLYNIYTIYNMQKTKSMFFR